MKKIKWVYFLAIMAFIAAFSKSAALAAPAQNASFTASLNVACPTPKTEHDITLKAAASSNDSSKTYQYKFVWQRNNWADWGIIKNFSKESTAVFTPTKPGTYVFIVDVTDGEGTVISKYSEKVKIDLCWSSPSIKVTQKSADIGSILKLEGTVNSNAKTPLKYKFVWSRDNWKSWGVVKNFDTASSATFTPKQPGKYKFYMDVIDSAGTVITAQSEDININLGWTPNATFSAPTKVVGNTISMSSSVKSDVTMSYKYKFVWCKDNWKEWGVISPLSSKNSASFIPKKVGTYKIYADFQDEYGNIKTIVSEEMKISTGWTPYVNLSIPSQTVDSTMTINAGVSTFFAGNSFDYKFVWSRDNWKEWGVVKNFDSATSANFTPKKNGTYTIYVDVADKYGNVTTINKSMYINAKWKTGAPKISMNGIYLGSKVTISPNVSGTIKEPKYKYVWSLNNWQEWGVIKNFSTSTSVEFYPKKAGKYDIYVDVMDSAGSVLTSSSSFHIGFSYRPLDEATKRKITGVSYPKSGAKISLDELYHVTILHYDFNGNVKTGELIVNKKLAKEVTEIFYELYLSKYPIHSVKLVDEFKSDDNASMAANNSSCFNYRNINNSSSLSKHAYGAAVDINPLFNPYVTKQGVFPSNAKAYTDRSKSFKGKIDKNDLAYKLFTKRGWTWGGSWNSVKDYQHFEKNI